MTNALNTNYNKSSIAHSPATALGENGHGQLSMFQHPNPNEIEQRKQCIILARDYYYAVQKANMQLDELEKIIVHETVILDVKQQIYRELLTAVEKCLTGANWEISLFFQGIANRMKALRDKLRDGVNVDEHLFGGEVTTPSLQRQGMVKVYVSLYQAAGDKIDKWASLLGNLKRLSIGRPIYREEKAVYDVLRARPDPSREAYVAVYVKEEDIIPPLGGRILKDRLDNELLTVREGAIQPENIVEFAHFSGRDLFRYEYIKRKLIQITEEK